MAKTVIGLFQNPSDAQSAMQDLQSAGFSQANANLIQSASSGLGNIFDQLAIPQQDASLYQAGLQNGGALVVLQQLADEDAYTAAAILDRHNVVDLDNMRGGSFGGSQTTTTSSAGMTTGSAGTTTGSTGRRNFYEGGEMVVPIVEEELRVGKREVESGGVRVNVGVEEVPVNEQVTLREEEVRVERRRVDQPLDAATASQAFQQGTVEVRERDEQAIVQKEARVVEEVVVGKEVSQRTETVQDTVRRTDVDVQEIGGTTTTTGFTETSTTGAQGGMSSTGGEGMIERGISQAGNAVEGATGLDLDRDSDVGQRDPRNNY